MEFTIEDIAGAISVKDGFSRVDWDVVENWLNVHFVRSDHRDAARLEAVLQWLELLADELGQDYWINSARRCILLTNQPRPVGDDLLRFAESALDRIGVLLDIAPEAARAPKHVLIRLHRIELYYTYISHYYAEGEYGGSGGVCIRAGMPHIVMPRTPYGGEAAVVAHELTHAVLNSFHAPAWVEEGVAQIIEQELTGRPTLQLNHEVADTLRAYWKTHPLDEFWCGRSFARADDGQRCSYQLAEVLVRLILADHRPRFLPFLEDSAAEDGGEAAAQEHFSRSLAEIARTFLGD
ncbi:MAG TPA: hypothetical protein P5572_09010 [Phycisphaerae bacterium]|nr:hypothetical protein [Phycisphaerae bacterium]